MRGETRASIKMDASTFYRLHSFVDLKDANEKWQAAYVLTVTDKEIQLQQESPDRSLWLPLKSSRLAPFRRFSIGQARSSFPSLYSLTSESLSEWRQSLTDITGAKVADPFQITQFYRGEMLYRLLATLDRSYTVYKSDGDTILSEVVLPCLRLSLSWLLNLGTTYAGYYQAQTTAESYLTDPGVAYAMAYREISLCLKEVLGEDRNFAMGISRLDELWRESNRVSSPRKRTSADWLGFVQDEVTKVYGDNGGFEVLLALIRDRA